jgi:hypothetical protein
MAKKSYKPPKVSGEFVRGESGKAKVRIKNKRVYVKFEESGDIYKFRQTRDLAKLKPGTWYIQLNGEEDEIYSFRPFSGSFKGKVESFAAREGEEPRPKVKEYTNKEGKNYTITSFTVLVDILEPEKFAGITIPMVVRYNFREAKDGEKSVVGLPDRGRHSKFLEEFCDLTGVWDRGPIKFSDNVLPEVEKRVLKADNAFMLVLKDGWVDTLFEADEPVDEDDWDEADDEPEAETESSDDDLDWDEE